MQNKKIILEMCLKKQSKVSVFNVTRKEKFIKTMDYVLNAMKQVDVAYKHTSKMID